MTNNTKNFLGRYWHWFFIAIAIIISLYIRIVNPWESVFTWTVRLSGNDPWYYYRIIQNLLTHFPERIWFDAFTNYPYGTGTHFGPFVVYLGAIMAKLGGATATSPEALRGVLSFVPTIGGTLLVFPAYLLTKELFNKKAGVIAALLIIMVPGQLLHRSVLSFNDHHVWEVLWMITTLALFSYSINKWSSKPAMENLKSNSVLAPIFTGLAIGMYLYSWAPGFIIVFILTLYVLIAYLLKHWINVKAENIAFIGIVTFLTAALIYLPYAFKETGFSFARYTSFPLVVLLGASAIMALFHGIEKLERKGYYSRLGIKEEYAFPATIVVVGVTLIAAIGLVAPSFLERIISIIGVVQKTGGALTVAEVQPFFTMGGGQFSLFPAWSTFATTFFFAIPGIIYTFIKFVKERNNLYLLAVVWGIAMIVALAGQNRFAYYFGAVSAIFAAIMLDAILRRLNFYEAVTGGIERLKKVGYIRIAVSILIIIAVFYPTFTMAFEQSKYAGGGINKQWFDTLTWMRTNTPNQEFYDQYYYQIYEPHHEGEYPYPQETYGVMSWWDYGHWIETIAHRMPNANPFQQGIGKKAPFRPGAAPFFTALNETYANNISNQLGVKYVVTDVEMATGKFYAMGAWAEGDVGKVQNIYYRGGGYVYSTPQGQIGIATSQYQIPSNGRVITTMNIPSQNYYQTMEAKFHIFDGDGLENYRMVYESNFASTNRQSGFMELMNRLIYNRYYSQEMEQEQVNIRSTGYVKVFEYVNGTTIEGTVEEDVDQVTINTTIQTNQGRTYGYQQRVEPQNGQYHFTVPYAQNTTYPVKAVSPYSIKAGNLTKTISLTDEDLKGRTINLNFP